MKKPLPKLFVDVEEVMVMHDKCKNWAYDHLKDIRIIYDVKDHQRVNLFQFCDYEGLPADEVLKMFSR